MTKDVKISLYSTQFNKEEEKMQTAISGLYFEKNGSCYILYDELMEGFDKPVKTKIKFKAGVFEICRSGAVNTRMFFEENKKNVANYSTPYGNILLEINTRRIDISNQPDRIEIEVDYALEADGEHLSDCNIIITIQSG